MRSLPPIMSKIYFYLFILFLGCNKPQRNDFIESGKKYESKFDSLYCIVIKDIDSLNNEINRNHLDTCNIEIYRFTWSRSFHPQMIFTISHPNKNYELEIKKDSTITNKAISEQQWNDFIKEINGAFFWSLLPVDGDPNAIGTDGATWVLEGKRNTTRHLERKYNIVYRHSPFKGSFRNACLKLIEYSELVPENEIY